MVTTELTEPDERGRSRPQPVAGTEEVIGADAVIIAFGFRPNPADWFNDCSVNVDDYGLVQTTPDDSAISYQTDNPRIFAGGDMKRGSDLVVTAVFEGRNAATSIASYLSRQP